MSEAKLTNSHICTSYQSSIPNGFGYRPSLVAGIIFTAIFLGTLCLHAWQTTLHRRFWLGAAFCIGAFGELAGWIARLAAYPCPYSGRLMEMQLAALIMAPAFTTAGIYGILTLVIPIIGRDKSPLRPRLYLIIFMIVDFFSGSLQAIGGGLAASSMAEDADTRPGTYTMVAGVVWQLVSTCVFATLLEVVILRARHTIWGNPYLMRLFAATMLSVTCMVIRGVYRSMELIQGWRGYLFTHERFAIALDGVMMFISLVVFNVWNPGLLVQGAARYEEMKSPTELQQF
ncbi:uncharacterized protein N7459_008740 [Penicillium hispanicum]|uniref:uncharacterized protein n=1 Tax=Penicillium hispanicum TaxID=1080232 RepID=UPI00253FBD6D|nr:uncharacterized protein N7459_008740 [Penicillium hispanicum]KAJ5574313.1 hypothetical protein N7459_008740 [Penicillium hispanicum]